ncbi:MAG: hypothetical protein ABIV94_05805 [Acidimicrobiales bacterium]
MIRFGVSAVCMIAALASCSSGASSGSGPAVTTTTTAPVTTEAPTTVPLQPQGDPGSAASALLDAWAAGDQAAAATVALPAAVQSLFGAGTPGDIQARGCSDAKFDPASCVYRTDAGEVQLRATMQGGGWIVEQARVTPA